MITNLETDPNGFNGRYQWGGKTVKRDDGRYMYVGTGNSFMGSCTQQIAMAAPVGHVIVLIAQTDDSAYADSKISAAGAENPMVRTSCEQLGWFSTMPHTHAIASSNCLEVTA